MFRKHLLLAALFSLYASSICATEWLPEAKAGYFAPSGHRFRKIYGGGGIYGLEVSAQAWRGLYPWANVSYFTKSGHSIGLNNRTSIKLVPFQIGLKYLFDVTTHSRIYVGLGMTPTYLNTEDSRYTIRSVHKWGVGAVFKAGSFVNFKHVFLDFFMDYSFTRIPAHDTHHHRVERNNGNVSGWTFGAGIGYRFGSPKQQSKTKTSNSAYSNPTILPESVPEQQSFLEQDKDEEFLSNLEIIHELKVDNGEVREELEVGSMDSKETEELNADYRDF